MLDRFSVLAGGLDHPEGVAWDPVRGRVYAGGEAGQIYAISLDGSVEQVATTGGFVLGVACDGDGRVYACDVGRGEVVRLDPASGVLDVYASGDGHRRMRSPNWLAFAPDGTLYVTDSGDWERHEGVIWQVRPGGEASVWTAEVDAQPNGCCVSADGRALLVVETNGPRVVRVPIHPDGSAGRVSTVVDLPGTTPDGITLAADGSILLPCYRPDAVLRLTPDARLEVLVEDPHAQTLGAPANLAFVGDALDRVVTSNLARWHVAIGEVGLVGLPLHRPVIADGGAGTSSPAAA